MTREQCIFATTICVFDGRDEFSDSDFMDILTFLVDEYRLEQERLEASPFDEAIPSKEYTVADIARAVGIYTMEEHGPHGPAVNAILSHLKLELGDQTNSAVNWMKKRYTANVIWKVQNWLAEHGLPTTITAANGTEYKITYCEREDETT